MKTYQETRTALQAAGWVVSPYPFIWHKTDNSGILSDPSRQPRHIYETALFATRGDRKIVRAVGNCYGGAISRQFHMSEKPKPMLEHFMRMLVDETTVMLDPTCGSGNSVAIAERLGANWATGLELNSEFALRAKENLDLT